MKGKIILISVLAVVIAATGTAAAYLFTRSGDLALQKDGAAVEESVDLSGLVPGGSVAVDYSVQCDGSALFTVAFLQGEESALDGWLQVRVSLNSEVFYEGSLREAYETPASCSVEGDFAFSVEYSLPEEVGNEAQGMASDVVTRYTLEGE